MRNAPLISAAVDGSGQIYVVWQDCRFRTSCYANDLVFTTSSDGVSWKFPSRIPIDDLTGGADHFLPAVSIDPQTSGSTAHIGVTYYSYSDAGCSAPACELFVNFIGSPDGGKTWSAPQVLAPPMSLNWLANSRGAMVGDYVSTVFVGGRPMSIVVSGTPNGAMLEEGTYATAPGIESLSARPVRVSVAERPVPGFHADHPPYRIRRGSERESVTPP